MSAIITPGPAPTATNAITSDDINNFVGSFQGSQVYVTTTAVRMIRIAQYQTITTKTPKSTRTFNLEIPTTVDTTLTYKAIPTEDIPGELRPYLVDHDNDGTVMVQWVGGATITESTPTVTVKVPGVKSIKGSTNKNNMPDWDPLERTKGDLRKSNAKNKKKEKNTTTLVALAVVLPVLALIGVCVWGFWWRKKNDKKSKAPYAKLEGGDHQGAVEGDRDAAAAAGSNPRGFADFVERYDTGSAANRDVEAARYTDTTYKPEMSEPGSNRDSAPLYAYSGASSPPRPNTSYLASQGAPKITTPDPLTPLAPIPLPPAHRD